MGGARGGGGGGGSLLVQVTLEGLRRTLAKLKVRKEPITADMLKAMVEAARPDPALTEVRLLVVCFLAYAGYMRCDQLVKLKCEDIAFNTKSMVVRIKSIKINQYRDGASLVIACTSLPTCHVGKVFPHGGIGELPQRISVLRNNALKQGSINIYFLTLLPLP